MLRPRYPHTYCQWLLATVAIVPGAFSAGVMISGASIFVNFMAATEGGSRQVIED